MPLPYDKSDGGPLYDDRLDANNPDNYNKFNNFEGEEETIRA